MPELAEVEVYRRLAERVVGRVVAEVVAPDDWYLKRGLTASVVEAALTGRTLTAARRTGKLLLLETDGPVLGLRFGMSGRLLVDGRAAVDNLVYASNRGVHATQAGRGVHATQAGRGVHATQAGRELEKWDRFAVRFPQGGDLRMRDPRRLGGVELDPPEARLGPDALTVGAAAVSRLLESDAPLKARLMDQSRLAGVGNLAADEALWRAGLDPGRPARSLTPAERRRLHRHLRATMVDLLARGGSHTGDLMPHRQTGGLCPKDGTPLVRRTIGGRTTWSCPRHQR